MVINILSFNLISPYCTLSRITCTSDEIGIRPLTILLRLRSLHTPPPTLTPTPSSFLLHFSSFPLSLILLPPTCPLPLTPSHFHSLTSSIGINLKSASSMKTMKHDMGGSAAALGTFLALTQTGPTKLKHRNKKESHKKRCVRACMSH